MNFTNEHLEELIALRRTLHSQPELAGKEVETAKKIKAYLTSCHPAKILENIAGHGLLAIFKGNEPGKNILLRADMDALPISELNDFYYKSKNSGVSHKCGHDGHSAILAGVAKMLSLQPIKKGNVCLLFQPAEETGEGAEKVLKDPKFCDWYFDHVFALHNLPGFAKNTVIIRKNHFAAASKGMIISLTGKTSHAANPEQGISPALAVSEIIRYFTDLSLDTSKFKAFKLITIVHVRMGEKAFGTTPGFAQVMATLRSYRNDDMELLTSYAVNITRSIADKFDLQERVQWTEEFPASVNDSDGCEMVSIVASENKFQVIEINEPFRWSEDFGHFLIKYPGVLFGIGAGEKHPKLHNPDYDFPDDIIRTGITMFDGIVRKFQ
ncbi:MAG: amidohydrolase [Sphingobacteriia bacterium]|nr:amidohydrolase [Sphingobacteriia bacterium]